MATNAAAAPAPGAHFRLISVVVPLWNEEAYVERTVSAASEIGGVLREEGEVADYEICLVNDGSTDQTAAMADAIASADPRVRVIHGVANRGLGAAVVRGIRAARGDLILYVDADLPADLWEVRRACRVLRSHEADIISAYRLDRTSEGPLRWLYSTAYNWLIRLLFGLYLRDVNFAFKLVRREVFDHVDIKSEGVFFDAELLLRAHKLGYDIMQIGLDYFPRCGGASTSSSAGAIARSLRDMLRLGPELRRLRALGPEDRAAPCRARASSASRR